MPKVELRGIRNYACRGTDLDVLHGELLVLLGPNGAGKTTLLNVIAGLVRYEGSVSFDGTPVDAVAAKNRKVGYLFQDLILFPHLDVRSNIGFGLLGNGRTPHQAAARVAELLDLLAISHLAGRYPATLSGGEKQRVALARALAPRPGILLLDEPFGGLDAGTGAHLRTELKYLQRDLGTTTVFVTHDLAEAEEVADRIAVIQDGVVAQIGTPEDVLFSPRDPKVTAYIGSPNVLECRATRSLGHGLAEADCGALRIVVPHNGGRIRRVVIAPRDVRISLRRPSSEVNVFEGSIVETTRAAGCVQAHIDVAGYRIAAELPRALFEGARLSPGAGIFVELSLMKLRTGS